MLLGFALEVLLLGNIVAQEQTKGFHGFFNVEPTYDSSHHLHDVFNFEPK